MSSCAPVCENRPKQRGNGLSAVEMANKTIGENAAQVSSLLNGMAHLLFQEFSVKPFPVVPGLLNHQFPLFRSAIQSELWISID